MRGWSYSRLHGITFFLLILLSIAIHYGHGCRMDSLLPPLDFATVESYWVTFLIALCWVSRMTTLREVQTST